MLKITLPNGVIIEGDPIDIVPLVSEIVSPGQTVLAPEPKPELEVEVKPEPEPELVVTSAGVLRGGGREFVELPLSHEYPHRYAPNGKRAVVVGERGDQILQAAKMLAEESGNRSREFTSREVLDLIDPKLNISTISSAMQSLWHQQLVRKGSNNRRWYVTEKGWNSFYRVGQPATIKPVRPTT